MAREPIAPLATRRFTTEEFNTRLAENLLKKKKKPEEREAPDSGEWDRILQAAETGRASRGDSTSPDMSEFEGMSTTLKEPEPSGIMKGINFLTEPLTGGYLGRKMREVNDAVPDREDFFQATGKGDIQDWLAWSEATLKGLKKGTTEGVADLADQLTSPADLAGLVSGGGAIALGRKGIQGANTLRRIAQIAGAPNIARGGSDIAAGSKNIFDEGLDFENAGQVGEGALRAAFGGAQMHFPASAIAKSKVKIPAGTSPVEPGLPLRTPEVPGDDALHLNIRGQEPQPDFAAETSLREPGYQGRTGGLDRERIPRENGPNRPLPAEEFSRDYPTTKSTIIPIEELVAEPPAPTPKAGDINDQLFPELAAKTTKPKVDIGVQESSLAPDPKARLDELGAKSNLTPAEEAEWDALVDKLHPDKEAVNLLSDDRGELDIDALYNKYQRMKLARAKPATAPEPMMDLELNRSEIPTELSLDEELRAAKIRKDVLAARHNRTGRFTPEEEAEFLALQDKIRAPKIRRFPGEEAQDIGAIPRQEVDLEQAGFEAASDTAKSVGGGRIQRLLSDEAGAVGSGPRKPNPADVWAQLPDNVKRTFQERGITQKDIAGYKLKDIQDTFDAIVRENAGLEIETPAPITPKASNEGVVDVSNVKFDTPQSTAKLVKKSGERVPLDEETRIKRLNEDAMKAVERERKIRLDAGEVEMLPDELDVFREQMQSGVRPAQPEVPENFAVETPQSARQNIPLLRSKNYIKMLQDLIKNEKGEIDFSALMGGDEIQPGTSEFAPDLMLRNEEAMGGTSPEFMPRQASPEMAEPSVMDMIRNFMADEEGSINFGESVPAPRKELGPEGQIPRESGPDIRLLSEEQLDPEIPIRAREVPEQEEPGLARKTWNTAQSMMSIDLPYMTSAAFRQASPLAWTDNWFKSWAKAAESFTSKESYDALMQEIKDSKYFKPRFKPVMNQDGEIIRYKELPSIAEELGLRLTDYSHLGQREESLRHSLAENIPIYKDYLNKSNRAYTAFLNSLRKSKFEQMMDAQTWTGLENDTRVAKQIAEFVNDATGRSSLKVKTPLGEVSAEKNAEDLAKILWSPRLLASRLKFLNPQTYIAADPAVRQEYISGLMRVIGTWGAFAGLAKMGLGAEVSTDMNSSDFGKIKIGNTRIDPGSGFQQLLVFGSRMATGEFTSSSTDKKSVMGEGFKPRTRKSTAEEFAASKLHPAAKLAYDLLSASQSSPVHVGDRMVQMALPMMAQDMMEVMKEDPSLAAMMGPLSSIGFGTSNYGRGDEFGKPVFTDAIDEFMGFDPRTTSLTVGGKAPRQTPRR